MAANPQWGVYANWFVVRTEKQVGSLPLSHQEPSVLLHTARIAYLWIVSLSYAGFLKQVFRSSHEGEWDALHLYGVSGIRSPTFVSLSPFPSTCRSFFFLYFFIVIVRISKHSACKTGTTVVRIIMKQGWQISLEETIKSRFRSHPPGSLCVWARFDSV